MRVNMKSVICLVFMVFSFFGSTTGQFGICVEMCGPFGSLQCPTGYECRSNGCGHTCQKVETGTTSGPIGICVDLCNPSGSGQCKTGYECKSNGCGHTCQKVATGPTTGIFGICVDLCDPSGSGQCKTGYECKSNGCGHTCQKVATVKCRPVLCEIFCVNGWQKNKDGCDICACA